MYTWWLIIPAVIGVIFGIINNISGDLEDKTGNMSPAEIGTLIFAFFISTSSTFMDQLWIRKQNTLAWQWGLTNFEETEEQMADFKGVFTKDPITGKRKKVAADKKSHQSKRWVGYATMLFFMSIVVACVIGLFFYRSTLKNKEGWGLKTLGYLNAIQIKIMNMVSFILDLQKSRL